MLKGSSSLRIPLDLKLKYWTFILWYQRFLLIFNLKHTFNFILKDILRPYRFNYLYKVNNSLLSGLDERSTVNDFN